MWLNCRDQAHYRFLRRVLPNNGMQETALRAAADAERWVEQIENFAGERRH
jgi:hypothetical protein